MAVAAMTYGFGLPEEMADQQGQTEFGTLSSRYLIFFVIAGSYKSQVFVPRSPQLSQPAVNILVRPQFRMIIIAPTAGCFFKGCELLL